MVKNQDQDNLEESEEEDISTDVVSHADAASALELALCYVEQHAADTPFDVMQHRIIVYLNPRRTEDDRAPCKNQRANKINRTVLQIPIYRTVQEILKAIDLSIRTINRNGTASYDFHIDGYKLYTMLWKERI
ncbi:hypothetical protein AVEN_108366-1 [Araneus ventricosus]|uniref:Uncharacterized protein n=1 Tax=Araneus ventricosus TaxID=182803 RepID=A0A4Y2CWQ7_ARAVE|nr:hypothetical protein AVEN_108366-1 [Araneus ventricosus]